MSSLTLDSLVTQHPDQVAAEADGEVLMMHIDSGDYFSLNDVASFLWQELSQPRTVAALSAAVQAQYSVAPAVCEADVMDFCGNMIRDGLMLVLDDPA